MLDRSQQLHGPFNVLEERGYTKVIKRRKTRWVAARKRRENRKERKWWPENLDVALLPRSLA